MSDETTMTKLQGKWKLDVDGVEQYLCIENDLIYDIFADNDTLSVSHYYLSNDTLYIKENDSVAYQITSLTNDKLDLTQLIPMTGPLSFTKVKNN